MDLEKLHGREICQIELMTHLYFRNYLGADQCDSIDFSPELDNQKSTQQPGCLADG